MTNLSQVNIDNVKRVYSGKLGCACGCRGNYYTDVKNIKRVVNLINKGEGTFDKSEDGTWASLETENRLFTVYF